MQDAQEITVAASGDFYVAPFGVALPEEPRDDLDPAFAGVGYLTDDGVTLSAGAEVEDISVWQKQTPARRIVTARTLTAGGSLTQWNPETFSLAFGGGEWSETDDGNFRYDPPADGDALPEYSAVIDWEDGDRHSRIVIYRCTLAGDVETQLVRNAAALLPISLNALTPDDRDRAWNFFTNDAAFALAS